MHERIGYKGDRRRSGVKVISLVFIDVKKAFDSINHGAITQALRSSGVPEILVGYIQDLYSTTTTRIIAGSKVSSPVSVARGVKHGDPMSPFLFNLVLDTCLRKLEGGVRLTNALRLNHIAFADDVVLIAPQMDELQGIFDIYTSALEQICLEIHPGKCQSFKVLVRNSLRVSGGGGHKTVHTNARAGLQHKGTEIPALSSEKHYKYLGVKVGVDRNRERKQLYEDCIKELSSML